ncbi:MAG: RNA polymerase factor sigma-54 [Desulfobacterales bacterium]|nr:RNA polymerase factor sigma-54 [Desulfobacterales bacterium]
MAFELRQQLKLSQQLIMTPQLQMAIKLLQLSRLELVETIHQELEENPALEEISEGTPEDQSSEEAENPPEIESPEREVTIEEKIIEDIDWSNFIDEYNAPGKISYETESKEAPRFESFVAQKESLSEHLLWQLMMSFPSKDEKEIGSLIIGNLNKDGYLEMPFDELVRQSGAAPEEVGRILTLMQTFNPIGVCARDLQECLLIQAKHLGLSDTIVCDIISQHLNHLENKNYKAICSALKANIDEVISAVEVIKGLEPRPGQQFSDEEPHYITPDIYVYKMDDEFVIVINDDGMPKLRVSSFYRNAMSGEGKVKDQAKEYLQDKLRSATWLIRSIHQRQKTIYRVMESIVRFQGDFFEKGIAHLKPMVLRDVALDIGMHESTISRVTTNKYAYTPQGIFELKYFFNSSISRVHGDAIASASVQDKIRQIIEGEDPRKPYSDSKITDILKGENIDIARRTVAKYREMLKVLPSSKRKQY